jgi:hypothetical protein
MSSPPLLPGLMIVSIFVKTLGRGTHAATIRFLLRAVADAAVFVFITFRGAFRNDLHDK